MTRSWSKSLFVLAMSALSLCAHAQMSPRFVETPGGEGQGILIRSYRDLDAAAIWWDMLVTANHLQSGPTMTTTTVGGEREIYDLAAQLPDVDIAVATKIYGHVNSLRPRFNALTSTEYVPVSDLSKMIGNKIYGLRVSSSAGGVESVALTVKQVANDTIIASPVSSEQSFVQSDSGMSIWQMSVSLDRYGEVPSTNRLIGFVSGAETGGIRIIPAETISDRMYDTLIPVSPELMSNVNVSGFSLIKGGGTGTRGQLTNDSLQDLSGRGSNRFFNPHDGVYFTIETDLGDLDRVIEGFQYKGKIGYPNNIVYLNQFRPGDGGAWNKVSASCSGSEIMDWSEIICRFNRPVIARGLRVQFNAAASRIDNFRILEQQRVRSVAPNPFDVD
ncbi:hypothetical protein [Ponticaulis profundi]|uniref:F5/8 type C domain-containing protein n=1 Tax=Ponticaulis profundi TaxID=2665222 RepID=A0ABW1SD33_9PROT